MRRFLKMELSIQFKFKVKINRCSYCYNVSDSSTMLCGICGLRSFNANKPPALDAMLSTFNSECFIYFVVYIKLLTNFTGALTSTICIQTHTSRHTYVQTYTHIHKYRRRTTIDPFAPAVHIFVTTNCNVFHDVVILISNGSNSFQ